MKNILKKIIDKKKEKIKDYKKKYPINKLLDKIKNLDNFVDFRKELEKRRELYGISYISFPDNAAESTLPIVERLTGK